MKSHLTMQELEDMGFEIQRSYTDCGFVTQFRKNKGISIKTTYEMPSGAFVSQKVKIQFAYKNLKPDQIIKLNKILMY